VRARYVLGENGVVVAAGTLSRSEEFDRLQQRLERALEANTAASGVDHVVLAMPSYSVGESLLSHYADRVVALEHRYLVAALMLGRIRSCEMVILVSKAPDPAIMDYYVSLLPADTQDSARERLHIKEVPGEGARSIAGKLLDNPELLDELRDFVRERPALIEPWNVTEAEVEVACRLGIPVNGTPPHLRNQAFKSAGRRLCKAAGVPVPPGREDVRNVDDIIAAIRELRSERPGLKGVLVKLDDSASGDGNITVDLLSPDASDDGLRRRLGALPGWYLQDLAAGAAVEELVSGTWFSSPSAQLDMSSGARIKVVATHEQVLGGKDGQTYLGCRFPADPRYAAEIAGHANAIGERLAQVGARGRCAIDFVAVGAANGGHSVAAVDINLRKGGTTHPYAVLRNVVPGTYDSEEGEWLANDGTTRSYVATDNAVDPAWRRVSASDLITGVRSAGVQFDAAKGSGAVLHMLSGLAIDGRFGMTAIGRSRQEADEIYDAVLTAVSEQARLNASI